MDFHTKLIMLLTELDHRQSKRKGWNCYALPQYFAAAETVTDAKSFADAFCPTRGMHSIARKLGLGLNVEKGVWIMK